MGPRAARAAGLVVGMLALAAAASAGWWYWQSRPVTAESSPVVAAQDVDQGAAVPLPEAAELLEAPAEGVAGDGAMPPSAGAAGEGRLVREFAGPCWLEVYDAEGRRLAFELAEAGAVFAFEGPAPWRVVLGNADAVRLTLDGSGLDIPASMKVRDAALVTIAGDRTVTPSPGDGEAQ